MRIIIGFITGFLILGSVYVASFKGYGLTNIRNIRGKNISKKYTKKTSRRHRRYTGGGFRYGK